MNKAKIENKIRVLERELKELKTELRKEMHRPATVFVPDELTDLFATVEEKVAEYFSDFHVDPASGEITVFGERYVLFRSASMSFEFINFIKERYPDQEELEAMRIGNNFLYDNAKVIGKKDAVAFHKRLNLKEPIEKLSAGPVHFAFTGWANVEIFPESNPDPGENYILKFQHHNSFEAQSWIKAGKKSKISVCTMNCGYSAGWCEESFGIPLTTVEITCEAKGDEKCTFIMAPPDKIEKYLEEIGGQESVENFEVPIFFQRQTIEEKLKQAVEQKQVLIQEIHHRVKNNLQVVTSLLRLQMDKLSDNKLKNEFSVSINRIEVMAAVHGLMYQEKDLDHINMKTYFNDLTKLLVQLYAINDETEIEIDIDIEDRDFDIEKSIPLALVINEIACNAFKHALKDGGRFHISLNEKEEKYLLTISDNGGGFDESKTEAGLGLSLIEVLCSQFDADLEVLNTKEGLTYKIAFSLPE